MIAATLFSGIGAPEQAMPDWRWPWHAEIDKFPSAVMATRHPGSINLGDVTAHDFTERAEAIARPDILVFGSPCQSYSVAGKRLGLDDPRGNLALVALGIVDRLKPRWFCFENVPGLFSSFSGAEHAERAVRESAVGGQRDGEEDRDFATFLARCDDIGYSLCWTVLDAQYFGVAQRRERVFAVGHLGDWRGPAAVLLEPESLCGNPPSREQARQDVAGAIGAGSARSGGRVGRREAAAGHVVETFNNTGQGWWNEAESAASVRKGDDGGGGGARESTLIAHALRADGFDASEDGTGRGTPLIVAYGGNDTRGPIDIATAVNAHGGPHGRLDFDSETFVAFNCREDPVSGVIAGSLGSSNPQAQAVAFHTSGYGAQVDDALAATLQASDARLSNQVAGVIQRSGVRRLTPRECERLQGFPDNFSAITYRGKPAKDGPRYKALGNSMAVPCLRWILERIEQVDNILRGVTPRSLG